MPTLGEACQLLNVSRRTLDKWLARLQIEPARHPYDLRYFTIADDELQRVRDARAQMPSSAPPGRARTAAPAARPQDTSAAAVVSLVAFSRALGIPENTAKSAAIRGDFPTFTRSSASNAPRLLDAAGQEAFRRWAAEKWQPKDV